MVPGDALAPQAALSCGYLDVDGLCMDAGIIPKEALLMMSRGSLKRCLDDLSDDGSFDIYHAQKLWEALLTTIKDSSVIDGHMTAVCNVICVFLQCAALSPFLPIQKIATSAETWTVVFDVLLEKFDGGKLKPLRQVLNALIKTLEQHVDRIRAESIQDGVLVRMTSIILLGKPMSQLKASMVIFEAFVRSGVPVSRVLSSIGRSYGSIHDQWIQRLRREQLDVSELHSAMQDSAIDESFCHFSFAIILAIAESNAQATAGTFFTSVTSMLIGYNIHLGSLWVDLIVATLNRYPQAFEAFKNYLLPSMLKRHSNDYYYLIQRMSSNDTESSLLHNALTIAILGRNSGSLSEKDVASSFLTFQEDWKSSMEPHSERIQDQDVYAALLKYSDTGVRMRAFELLATSSEMTKPLRSPTLQLLSNHLVYIQGDSDPGNRGEISSMLQAMLNRLRRGSVLHSRALLKPGLTYQQTAEHQDELKAHEAFLDVFIEFLEQELGPSCSFPRHISALKALQILVQSGLDPISRVKVAPKSTQDLPPWPLKRSLHSSGMRLALWQLLLDPFEEVRAMADLVLSMLLGKSQSVVVDFSDRSLNCPRIHTPIDNALLELSSEDMQTVSHQYDEISRLVTVTNELAALTNRADHADGAARVLSVHYSFAPRRSAILSTMVGKLEMALGLADGKTSLPAEDFSIHGYLLGLEYIVQKFGFQDNSDSGVLLKDTSVTVHQLLKLSDDVWHAVRADLCVDSPELSHDVDATDLFGGPKDFLSYSWRALRDSSLLLQAVLLQLGSHVNRAITEDDCIDCLRAIHALCFEQLTTLRHRGAFSTVAQTFALCCEQFASVRSVREELTKWNQIAFEILEDQSSRLTRRSAGIPAIMAGVLIPSSSEEFNHVVKTLASLATSETSSSACLIEVQQTRLPQVHALNCLREIFTNYKFKAQTVTWLMEVLDLAASNLSSRVWAIRNCGLMLFRACASRVGTPVGVSDSGISDSAVSNQSETVLSIAFRLLNSEQHSSFDSPELIFAGLDLMSRIRVPGRSRSRTEKQILLQLGSPIWMIREHAARLHAFQIPEKEAFGAAVNLISTMISADQNRCHGILLCSRELLGKHVNASLPFSDAESHALEQALNRYSTSTLHSAAPAVQCAFSDMVNDCMILHICSEVWLGKWSVNRLPWSRRPQIWDAAEQQIGFRRQFESQLRSSSAWHSALLVLNGVGGGDYNLYQIFQEVAEYDLDAAAALLHALRTHYLTGQHVLQLQVDLYVRVIHNICDESILAAAMYGLSSCLELDHQRNHSVLKKHDLGSLFDCFVNLPYSGCRDLFNARLRALGSVLAHQSNATQSVWNQHPTESISLWITMLSSAAKDATEALTRLNAAKSLHAFRRCLLAQCDEAAARKKIVVFSILYDFLNDDAEEIRELAASTASFILASASDIVSLPLCPLAACHQLSIYMAQIFSYKHDFHLIALSRIMLPTTSELDVLKEFGALASSHSVKNQLDLAFQESYDLFEEERQNLYLDDIREVDIWYLALGKVSSRLIDDNVRVLAGGWALDGLRELTAALPGLKSGPFGAFSKLEIVTLFLRVARLASLLLESDEGSNGGMEISEPATFLKEIENLLAAAQHYSIHSRVLKALGEGVNRGRLALSSSTGVQENHQLCSG